MSPSLYIATSASCAPTCCEDTPSPSTVPAPGRHRRLRRPRPPRRSTSSEISELFGSNGYVSSCKASRQSSVDDMQDDTSTMQYSQLIFPSEPYLPDIAANKASEPPRLHSLTDHGKSKEKREDSGISLEDDSPRRTSTPVEAFIMSHDLAYDGGDETQVGLKPALKGRLDPLALTEAINFLTLGDAGAGPGEADSAQLDDGQHDCTPISRVEPGVVVCDGVHWLPKDHAYWKRPEWTNTARVRKCSAAAEASTILSTWKVTDAGIVPAQPCTSLSDASPSSASAFPPSPSPSDDKISITAIAPFSRRASRRNSNASDDSINLSSGFPSTAALGDPTQSPTSLPDLCPEYCDAILDWAAAAHDMNDARSEYALENSRQRANKASKSMKRSLDAAFAKEFNCKRQKIREERKRRQGVTTTGYASSLDMSEDEMMLGDEMGLDEGEMRRGERVGSIDEAWLQPERTEYFVLT